MSIKAILPWWSKIIAKVFLSRMPVSYKLWQRFALFKHGDMEQPEYAYNVFKGHIERFKSDLTRDRCVALELGPGDSLATAMLAQAFGVEKLYLIDTGPYARDDLAPYQRMAAYMATKGLKAPDMAAVGSLDDLLKQCNAHYATQGLRSLKTIPDGSVDFIFSQAVLEHIRKGEFADMVGEMRRILRPDGMCSHIVDLKDHLGGALNNLRFSEALWESDFMARSGFYTNRIRFEDMLKVFSDAGFLVDIISVEKWDGLPTPRRRMAKPFSGLAEEQLLVSGFSVVLRPATSITSNK
jgi:SAM-dependent methyltransferase